MIDQPSSGGKTRWPEYAILGAVCTLVTGVYVWCAHSGMIELYGSGAADTYYNLLVQGFRAGQLNLKTEVPPGLAQLADPYVAGASFPYRWIAGHPLHDLSYYQGKLYLYFGVTPALLLFWPYTALTGHYLLHKDAVVVFCALGFLASVGLLCAVWQRYFAGVSFWVVVAGALALGLADFTPAILQRCDVYEVPISCGYVLVMLALGALWRALQEPRRRGGWLAAASLAYGLAVGARPPLLFGAVILLVPVIQVCRQKQRTWPVLLAAIGPIMLIGIGLMVYNALRFGNPLEFGQRYQLGADQQERLQQFSLRYLWFNFRFGFLEPACWSGRFPFVQDLAVPLLPRGASVENPFGVLTNSPVVWLAVCASLAWRDRPAEGRPALRGFLAAVATLFGICALTLGLHNSMCLRYEAEFAPMLVLLAVLGILGLERTLASRPVWRRVARCGWGLLLTFSLAFNLLASFARHAEALINSGNALLQRGQVEEAIAHFQKALKIQPDYAAAHNNFGGALLRNGQAIAGMAHFQRAVELQPEYAEAHYNFGNALLESGQVNEAIAHFQAALTIRPDFAAAHYNLGLALLQQGRIDEAIVHYQKTLEIQPHDAAAHNNLGNALFLKGRVDEAIAHYQKALEIQPGFEEACNNLGHIAWVLATSPKASVRNGAKAVMLAQQASQLSGGGNPVMLGTLAAAEAEAGRFAEAVTTAQHAVQLAAAQTNISLVNALQAQARLYQAGLPFRDSSHTAAPVSASQPGPAH